MSSARPEWDRSLYKGIAVPQHRHVHQKFRMHVYQLIVLNYENSNRTLRLFMHNLLYKSVRPNEGTLQLTHTMTLRCRDWCVPVPDQFQASEPGPRGNRSDGRPPLAAAKNSLVACSTAVQRPQIPPKAPPVSFRYQTTLLAPLTSCFVSRHALPCLISDLDSCFFLG